MNQLFDLLTSQFATASKFGQYLFAIFARLVDHLATLLFGQFKFGFHIRCGVTTASCSFNIGIFANANCIRIGFTYQTLCGFGGTHSHLSGGFACNSEYARGFFAQQCSHGLFVKHSWSRHAAGLHRTQFAFQKALTLL